MFLNSSHFVFVRRIDIPKVHSDKATIIFVVETWKGVPLLVKTHQINVDDSEVTGIYVNDYPNPYNLTIEPKQDTENDSVFIQLLNDSLKLLRNGLFIVKTTLMKDDKIVSFQEDFIHGVSYLEN